MTSSASTSPPAAPASAPTQAPALAVLRADLDRIDNAIHDLLLRRAELVEQVASQGGKSGVAIRPGREADIIMKPSSLLYVQALKFLETKATPPGARRAVRERRVRRATRKP